MPDSPGTTLDIVKGELVILNLFFIYLFGWGVYLLIPNANTAFFPKIGLASVAYLCTLA